MKNFKKVIINNWSYYYNETTKNLVEKDTNNVIDMNGFTQQEKNQLQDQLLHNRPMITHI
jgi:hypothetical protein